MSLTNRILPGDVLDGTKVRTNFVDLESLAEGVRSRNVDPNNIDTRHLLSTWTDVGFVETTAAAALGAAYAVVTSVTASTTSGHLFEILAAIELDGTAAAWQVDIEVRVDTVALFTGRWEAASLNETAEVFIPLAYVATAATHTIDIRARVNIGTANYVRAQIVVEAPRK